MTDLLDETTTDTLTQEDYDRAYKLDAGIKKLQAELDALKDRIKAESPDGKGTYVHGNVVVEVGERRATAVDVIEAEYPVEEYPGYYKTVLNLQALPKVIKDSDVYKEAPTKTLSIKFAS